MILCSRIKNTLIQGMERAHQHLLLSSALNPILHRNSQCLAEVAYNALLVGPEY